MKKLLFVFLLGIAFAFTSCDKSDDSVKLIGEDEISITNVASVIDTEVAIANVMTEVDYESDMFTLEESSTKSGGYGYRLRNLAELYKRWRCYQNDLGPEVTIEEGDNDGFPMTITIDYGDGITLRNGRVISGIVTIVVSAPPRIDGAMREFTYQNFKVDSIGIAGYKKVVFSGESGVSRKFEHEYDLNFTFADETEVSCVGNKTKEWVEGLDTSYDRADDKIHITGQDVFVDSENNEFKKEIADYLARLGTCKYIVSGIVVYSQNGEEFARVDFGAETCDDKAVKTTADGEEEITLGKHRHGRNK
ncbi:hypothetical protein DWB61_09670 [Ancylomarina euxinus]|uniref:Uncharacterized protein n=1 Tax=Ancylomarina euxinus TaxID=2283627 RepID=A0A425Y126_9BACT|nr:hypothetical protein [Ancylomarina euxinus]MCZ4693804.1 hypothetical protein [Ancylomarina euxinus]MUP15117.1 hypothetical protein [Ancylomarina euxinus]RRG21539.1 hypothetical protein DWB61_09670 [Ancylomarina euxinus]